MEAFGLLNHRFISRTSLPCHLKWLISRKLSQSRSIGCTVKKKTWNIINMLLGHTLCFKAVPRLGSKHDMALMMVTGGGITWMVPPYRSHFWPLTGISKHTNKNLYNAPVRLCWVRNWHKGQNWEASLARFAYTDSGFCFQLMEWEIQTCKCNSALTSSIHLPKKEKGNSSCFLFLPQI